MPTSNSEITTISPYLKEFFSKYQGYLAAEKAPPEVLIRIHVDEIASKIATFYERLRNIVDYREEHLLRKGAIERILKRRILLRWKDPNIAETLIKEIIRAGHLPNDVIPEAKIKEVQKIIDKYIFLFDQLETSREPDRNEIFQWLMCIGACEIEEKLDPPFKDNILANLMFQVLNERLIIQGGEVPENIKSLQLFINIQRALLRVDNDQLNYRLIKFLYPDWADLPLENSIQIIQNLSSLKNEIQDHIDHPLGPFFFRLCNRYNTIFYLIGDIVYKSQNFEEMAANFSTVEQFEKAIKAAYQKRYQKEKGKLGRLSFYSVTSFFLTKIAVAIGIEIPLDKYLVQHFSWLNIIISIVFPPLLMLIIVSSIRMPSAKNLKLVLEESEAAVFSDKSKNYVLKIPPKKFWLTQLVVNLFYLIMFIVSFGILTWILLKLDFSIASVIIFLLFTSLVAMTGVKAYNRSRELSLEEEKSTILTFLIDLFAMPLVTVGKWAAYGLSKFNIIIIALDLAIELPLQVFVVFLENFRGFIKGKKDEIY